MIAMIRSNVRSFVLAALAIMLVATSFVALPSDNAARAATASSDPLKLGYFYIPPNDGTTPEMLASKAGFITLTQSNEAYRDSLRSNGYTGDVLKYIVAAEVEGPGPYANASAGCDAGFDPLRNQVTDEIGDFCTFIHANESWFLHNGAGKRLYSQSGDGVYYRMNPGSAGWRQFALGRMKADLDTLGYDGIFLDNVEMSQTKSARQLDNSDGTIKEYASDAAFKDAWLGYLAQLSGTLRPVGKLWANMINDPNSRSSWNPYLNHLDGGMFESFALGYRGMSAQKWDNNLRQAEAALAAGKGVLAVSAGPKTNSVKQTFALSSYLLIANGGDSYFRYASNTNAHEYSSFWQYPNYDVELGNPKGARYATGTSWRRDFECGYVSVDPTARTSTITATGCEAGDAGVEVVTPTPTPSPIVTPAPSSTITVAIAGLPSDAKVSGTVNLRAAVLAPRKQRQVKFYLDNTWIWSEGIAPYYLGGDTKGVSTGLDTRGWSNGAHVLSVVVINPDGTEATKTATITVQN